MRVIAILCLMCKLLLLLLYIIFLIAFNSVIEFRFLNVLLFSFMDFTLLLTSVYKYFKEAAQVAFQDSFNLGKLSFHIFSFFFLFIIF